MVDACIFVLFYFIWSSFSCQIHWTCSTIGVLSTNQMPNNTRAEGKNRYTGAPYHIFVSLCIHNSESYIPCDSTRIEHRVWRTCNFRFEAMYLSLCADEMNQTHAQSMLNRNRLILHDGVLFGFVWDVFLSLGYWTLIINSDRQSIRRSHQIHHKTIDEESCLLLRVKRSNNKNVHTSQSSKLIPIWCSSIHHLIKF